MIAILAPINGVRAHKCQNAAHLTCGGAWWSFTRMSKVACGCFCHEPAQQAFDLDALEEDAA